VDADVKNSVSDDFVYSCVNRGFGSKTSRGKTKPVRKSLSNKQLGGVFREIKDEGKYQSHGISPSEVSSGELRRIRLRKLLSRQCGVRNSIPHSALTIPHWFLCQSSGATRGSFVGHKFSPDALEGVARIQKWPIFQGVFERLTRTLRRVPIWPT
jgi:hypothetical protein